MSQGSGVPGVDPQLYFVFAKMCCQMYKP
jgi:hypothetical protein